MVTRPNSTSFGFSGRRARFEHDTLDQNSRAKQLQQVHQLLKQKSLQTTHALRNYLLRQGFELDMPRFEDCSELISPNTDDRSLTASLLADHLSPDIASFLIRILLSQLSISDFEGYRNRFADLFEFTREACSGTLPDYIPELAKADPRSFGMAVCSIDGQRFGFGNQSDAFSVQSVVKPLNYALALSLNGESFVHHHVGREPSGRRFNELALNADNRPHNPMINAGAIMCCSLIRPGMSVEDRFDLINRYWSSAIGDQACGFDSDVYQSELKTAERNFALAKLMQDHHAFPEGSDVSEALDLYFRCCSMTLDCRSLSVVAASLANGGVCPLTGHRIAESTNVRNTLSLMLSCGMYDFSGEYAFTVGLPAKSGVSGAMMIVIPGVCGIALWSPLLDRQGNSVRGVEFSRRLVKAFPFHVFAGVTR